MKLERKLKENLPKLFKHCSTFPRTEQKNY